MKKVALEILISTMNRSDLSFLEPLFPGRELSEFHILVINQTTPQNTLTSDRPNIRVINAFEYGLSKSRNLALKNSIGEVALIADDDVVYSLGFDATVIQAFEKYPTAGLISFQMVNEKGQKTKKYTQTAHQIFTLKGQPKPSSVELAMRPKKIRKEAVFFNENFGLGAEFQGGEEQLFFKDILQREILIYHVPQVILKHPGESSGTKQGSEKFIYAISGLKYLAYGFWARFWLLKFVFFLVRNRFISVHKIVWSYQIGLKGICRSRQLKKAKK